jgi:alpha-L-rhamnosidase
MNLQPVHAAGPMGVPCRLRCEYLVDPLGIDVRQPRLSWEVRDRRRGARQSAYQVRVAADRRALGSAGAAIWDSGKVDSAESVHIPYQGRALISREHCWWKVRTWDAEGRPSRWSAAACWTMGLLEPADWQARWIADPAPPPPDSRAHNGYRSLPAPSADAGQWVVLDLGTLRAIDGVRFYGARPFDLIPPDAPGYLFPIRFKVEVAADASFSAAQTVVDCTQQDVVNPGSQPWTRRFAALQGRYVRLLVTRLQRCAEEGYAFALAEMEVLYGEENVALGSPVTAPDAVENATWSAERLTDGDVWPHPAGPALPLPAPLFRQEFHLAAPVRRATVYVSALGLYELRLNGQRVGDQLLAPGWTDYEQWVQYQAYDVTALLRPGQNAVGALLGDGWYAGRVAMAQVFRGRLRGVYGRQPRLLVQLEIELADGGRQTIASDAAWRSTLDGPIRSSDIYDGETYDARRALPGWDLPNFPEAGWRPVALAPGSGPERVADLCQPIRVRRELKSRSVNSPEPGLLVIDFGQCFAGWVRVRCVGRAGTVVTVRHGQVLNAAGRVHFADLRGALQTDRYILCGDPAGETLEPHFTYHGLRYVEISGLTATPDATGVVFGTDLPPAGSFACSDRTLNALWRAVDWTLRSNCMSIHTDCCDRDERLPWVIPDINQAEFYVADMAAFASRFAAEMRRAQLADGGFPNMAPNALKMLETVPGWGEASGIWMVWAHYLTYGDRRLLAQHYPAARRWAERLAATCPERISRGFTFGDWLNGETVLVDGWQRNGCAVPMQVMGTACFGRSAAIVAAMARAVGEPGDAARFERLFGEFRDAFTREFVDQDGRILGDTQAGYAIALAFGMLPESRHAAARTHLAAAIARAGGRLTTGNITSHLLLQELSQSGRHDLAVRLVTNPDCPSWGYMLRHGATAIWERWDGFLEERQGPIERPRWQALHPWETHVVEGPFQDPGMNSYNHPGYLLVAQWMVESILGIAPSAAGPAFRRFTVRPQIGALRYARGSYRSLHGVIRVAWHRAGDRLTLNITVPPGTRAEAHVPCVSADRLRESGGDVAAAVGVAVCGYQAGRAQLELLPGAYRFESEIGAQGMLQGRDER